MQVYSREQLQGMKAACDEKIRLDRVDQICSHIHHFVKQAAEQGKTSYVYALSSLHPGSSPMHTVSEKSLLDILQKLRKVFPACDVKQEIIAKDQNGKSYDLSKYDPSMGAKQFTTGTYITVDWS
jgi:hypothetical protein